MNTILSAIPVNSPVSSLNTDTRCKGRPILVLWESGYSPEDEFGTQTFNQGTTQNVYRYTGQQSDADSALLYLRARYYEPSTSRFISQDPKKGDPKNPKTFNLYVYCLNNPINNVDPSGLSAVIVILTQTRPWNSNRNEYDGVSEQIISDLNKHDIYVIGYYSKIELNKANLEFAFKVADHVIISSHGDYNKSFELLGVSDMKYDTKTLFQIIDNIADKKAQSVLMDACCGGNVKGIPLELVLAKCGCKYFMGYTRPASPSACIPALKVLYDHLVNGVDFKEAVSKKSNSPASLQYPDIKWTIFPSK